MNWIEFSVDSTNELAEAISDALFDYVEGGVVIEQYNDQTRTADRWEDEIATGPVVVRGYLPNDETFIARRDKVEFALRCLNLALSEQAIDPIAMPTYREVQTTDWSEKWKETYKPLRIGKNVLIRPSWIVSSEISSQINEVEIVLDPGQAFGTGLHPTTQLCSIALETLIPEFITKQHRAPSLFDIGSGSAILTILAAKLGANPVIGVDNDHEAVRVGIENATINDVSTHVHIAFGSWDYGTPEKHDIVVANILAPVIISMLKEGLTHRGAHFIFSGILDTQAHDVMNAMRVASLKNINLQQLGDWVCLTADN